MRNFLAVLAALFASPAFAASSFMTDASDLWWNPGESGWGVNIIQQANVLFATFFVYGPDGRARWYVASDMRCPSFPTDVQMVCTGILYETTGPVVGPAFDPSAVTRRAVGEARFFYSRGNAGQFSYTVDGVTVSKDVRRQTWAENDVTGEYNGMRVTRPFVVGCSMPNVVTNEDLGTMTVSRSGNQVAISTRLGVPPTLSCTYSGTLSQAGRMSDISGSYNCSDGSSGGFTLRNIEVSKQGFLGELDASLRGCNVYGNFGGTRTTVDSLPD